MPNILSFAIKLRYELLIRTGTTAQDAGMTAQNEWNTQYKLVGPPGDITQFELNAIYSSSALKYKAISIRDVTLDFMGCRH